MSDQLDKVFYQAKEGWNRIKEAAPPEIHTDLDKLDSLIQTDPARADLAWKELLQKTPWFESPSRQSAYEGYRNAGIALKKPPSVPVEAPVENAKKSERGSSGGGGGHGLSDEQLFNASVDKFENELKSRLEKNEDIPKDLFTKCVQATIIEQTASSNSKSYKSAQDAAFAEWCAGKTPEQINTLGARHRESDEYQDATNRLYLQKNAWLAKKTARVEAQREKLSANHNEDYLFRKIFLPVANGYLLGNNKKWINAQEAQEKLLLNNSNQKKITEYLERNFRTKFATYAQKDSGLKALLDKHGVSLPIFPSLYPTRRFSFLTRAWGKGEIESFVPTQIGTVDRINNIFSNNSPLRNIFSSRKSNPTSLKNALPNPLKSSKFIRLLVSNPVFIAFALIIFFTLILMFITPGTSPDATTTTPSSCTVDISPSDINVDIGDKITIRLTLNYSNVSGGITTTLSIPSYTQWESCQPSNCTLQTNPGGESVIAWDDNFGATSTIAGGTSGSIAYDVIVMGVGGGAGYLGADCQVR